jgi:solute carrier family 50 protein (sugar transporter)
MGFALQFFRVIAACTSTMMILSPIPSLHKTLRDKTTGVGSIVPLVSMFTNCHIAMMFGYLCELYFPVFSTFVVGDILCLTYIGIFYRFSHEKAKAHRVFLLFGIPNVLITIYSFLGGYGVTNQTPYDVGLHGHRRHHHSVLVAL